jgi:hypothetical protein
MNKATLFTGILMVVGGFVRAQDSAASPPPPTPPLAQPLPAMAHLVLSLQDSGTSPASAPKAPTPGVAAPDKYKLIDIVRTGEFREIKVTQTSGTQADFWVLSKEIFGMAPDGIRVFSRVFSGQDDLPFLRPENKIYGTEWLSLENYQGVQSHGGVVCYHYATTARVNREAWIDVKTGLPVAVQFPEGLYEYTFMPPPTEMLQPPPAFVADYKKELDVSEGYRRNAAAR